MVGVTGHLGLALLWTVPAWFVWDDRVGAAFAGLALPTAVLPDVDILIERLFPSLTYHHGGTHTIVFVVGVAVVGGALTAPALADRLDRWTGERFDARRTFAFATAAYAVGGLSHLFGDVLSAPDIAPPIEPFRPFVDVSLGLDLVWYASPWWNFGLLTAGTLAHALLVSSTVPFERPLSFGDT